MGRPPCCEETGVKKGPWTPEEDEKLIDYISKHGSGSWRTVPKHAGLNRCGKSCRLRWTNYLRPDIKRGKLTEEEERLIINLHSVLGNKWSNIATHLPGRTDNEIKNFWNTNLRKKLLQMGIDPDTHKPRTDLNHLLNLSQLLWMSNNNLMMSPWSHAGLGLQQQPDVNVTHQLAQIQVLQNLLQLLNGNSSFLNTNMQSSLSLSGNHCLINNPLEQYVNGTNSSLSLPNIEEAAVFPAAPSDCSHQDVSESWTTDLEAASNQEAFDVNSSGIRRTSSHEVNQVEIPLPAAIVSANFNQMNKSSNTDEMSNQSPPSTVFDAWQKLLEDDTSDSYWKELLHLTSTSESPITW